ncbi:hypothetical protein B0G57_1382 [Trinickia symbiotica]|uniref:Uncharacterized protein n=1 Tax=Trinickia symbiotica TaxID=863227 RepID=A0A2N7WWY5_9BURK|nr:hypothetical protein [Trinickia symbiotica]PMS33851.1 hypothetical protein C0Z20_23240 [Trinickia symbiotica]PPK41141.1 hypothetical protein B0G57_1382 [Trinickia symbiotica]
MKHPDLATHMVSLCDEEPQNNALGYCSSTAHSPDGIATLTPLGTGWARWALRGTKVVVKWLNLAGAPEFVHVLDGETTLLVRLPRRLLQRSPADVVTLRTANAPQYPAGLVVYYGTASALWGNAISVTPLGSWRYALPAGATVEIQNLSDPANRAKSGIFVSQSSVDESSNASVTFLKDSPAG